ncbi:hypothetical protein B9Z65_5589 [Elsinoe australis]|uniref:Uncharacterized protein n=1 Tax=Elsinoe australis TaxID=40998 RepID=A0A2P7ZJM9_9PEZI|nr:hypothetical protein B9Z65_5589 [Elsinoe australis]
MHFNGLAVVTVLLGVISVQASPAPAGATKAVTKATTRAPTKAATTKAPGTTPAVPKQFLLNPSFETAAPKNSTGAASWEVYYSQLVVRKTDETAKSGRSYLSISVNPSISNTTFLTQEFTWNGPWDDYRNCTLTGFYRVKNYTTSQSTDPYGLWYVQGDNALVHRAFFKGNTHGWQPFTAKVPNPGGANRGIRFVISGKDAAFSFDLDGLSLAYATKKENTAKNHVASIPLTQFPNPSFEKPSNSTPFAAGWDILYDRKYDFGTAQAVASNSSKTGERVMRLTATTNQTTAVTVAMPYLDESKDYNISCWVRIPSFEAPAGGNGTARLDYRFSHGGNSAGSYIGSRLFHKVREEWSLVSTKVDAGGYGYGGSTDGTGRLIIAAAGDSTSWWRNAGSADFTVDIDQCVIKQDGRSQGLQPWST